MTSHGNLSAQLRCAQTISLMFYKRARTLAKRQNEVVQLPEVLQDANNNGVWTSPLLHHISRDKRKQWDDGLQSQ